MSVAVFWRRFPISLVISRSRRNGEIIPPFLLGEELRAGLGFLGRHLNSPCCRVGQKLVCCCAFRWKASAQIADLDVLDYTKVPNAVALGRAIPSEVTYEVRWSEPISRDIGVRDTDRGCSTGRTRPRSPGLCRGPGVKSSRMQRVPRSSSLNSPARPRHLLLRMPALRRRQWKTNCLARPLLTAGGHCRRRTYRSLPTPTAGRHGS